MTNAEPSAGRAWRYQFSEPGGIEIETGEFSGDGAAEARGRQLSEAKGSPVIVKRHAGHVDAWDYVTEVDERP
jgi:hypothetical protein